MTVGRIRTFLITSVTISAITAAAAPVSIECTYRLSLRNLLGGKGANLAEALPSSGVGRKVHGQPAESEVRRTPHPLIGIPGQSTHCPQRLLDGSILCQMASIGLPVPPGFTLTTEAAKGGLRFQMLKRLVLSGKLPIWVPRASHVPECCSSSAFCTCDSEEGAYVNMLARQLFRQSLIHSFHLLGCLLFASNRPCAALLPASGDFRRKALAWSEVCTYYYQNDCALARTSAPGTSKQSRKGKRCIQMQKGSSVIESTSGATVPTYLANASRPLTSASATFPLLFARSISC